ncbi:phospholipase D-like domain-containing protein [Microbacterium sp. HD4P20]|uniref:phospholipase D family protein n=1 Tax=Microbacterium sp. HD4P20 TaxID=2864874 RepID=UPI001C642624|nr:phospholipase D-like domain-containing protein [Microbacterium sp. HD4P20]MCP2638096.1 phospholipase D-like domain-containing protein [Microbacterium sp. HD4P20]
MARTSMPAGFLPEQTGADHHFRPPPRRSCHVTPVIDGTATAVAIEEAILGAADSIHLAYWHLEPALPVQSRAARAVGFTQFGELLLEAAAAGVDVRVFLTDVEPLGDPVRHLQSWAAYRRLVVAADARASGDPGFDRDKFQVVCALPSSEFTPDSLQGLTTSSPEVMRRVQDRQLKQVIKALNAMAKTDRVGAVAQFSNSPGLWADIEFTAAVADPFVSRGSLPRAMCPASHHVKLAIIDGLKAVVGGSNLNGRILDGEEHEVPDPRGLTHDVNCMLEGDIVGDFSRFFQGIWNLYYGVSVSYIAGRNPLAPPFGELPLGPANQVVVAPMPKSRPHTSVVQLVRTFAGLLDDPPAGSGLPPLPDVLRGDIEESYEAAILSAKRYIYIENQYFRSAKVGDWLKKALAASPALRVIVVLPERPEEDLSDPFTHRGRVIRAELIADLTATKRAGFFTMRTKTPTIPSLPDTPPIYVHSKIMLVDDVFATIGTANLNSRGFAVDTEVNIAWSHPRQIRKLRLELWAHQLNLAPGNIAPWKPVEYLSKWQILARSNAALPPTPSRGFAVPLVEPAASALGPNPLLDSTPAPLHPTIDALEPLFEVYSGTTGEPPAPGIRTRPKPRAAVT